MKCLVYCFYVKVTISRNQIDAILECETCNRSEAGRCGPQLYTSGSSNDDNEQEERLSFRISVNFLFTYHSSTVILCLV